MHKIELISWDYTCGDGCCYDNGIRLVVDGDALTENVEINPAETIRRLLDKLMVKYELTEKYE